jgi:hypothetical protein
MIQLRSILKIILLWGCFLGKADILPAQILLSGTVYDSSKVNYIPGVKVMNNAGRFTYSDSLGKYSIPVSERDSITFTFRNKSTQKFAVHTITDPDHFDISIMVPYKGKYSTMKEVIVHTRSYREDSMENRQTYAKIYNFQKPTLQTSISPSGVPGADVDEIINMFRFRRNKSMRKFQLRLEADEQEKYVTYRFNKTLIKRITHLEGEQLNMFMMKFRPTYEFTSQADELTFNQYILNCSYQYKIELLQQDAPKQKT